MSNQKRIGFTHESARNESVDWYTPPELFDALGLTFDLDPCSAGEGRDFVPARNRYTIHDDGLAHHWRGLVWCNPPYGRNTPAWMRRMSEHGNGIALVFARTDPAWFQDLAPTLSAVQFISGRVRFYAGNREDRGGTPGAGSMLLAWGGVARDALLQSGLGTVMIPHE